MIRVQSPLLLPKDEFTSESAVWCQQFHHITELLRGGCLRPTVTDRAIGRTKSAFQWSCYIYSAGYTASGSGTLMSI